MRWLAIGVVAIGVASGLWFAVGSSQDTPEIVGETPDTLASGQAPIETKPTPMLMPTPEEPVTPPPDYHIERSGRLSLDVSSLPADGVVTFGLALDEDALGGGQDPLPAVVVSASDGRRLELSATPAGGAQSGARLEIDSAWFEPGLYMIQIRTKEKTALPLLRYVLEVKAAVAPPAPDE